MDGKPLYEYARSGTPLPRPIERRKVTVHSLELVYWLPSGSHAFRFPEKKFTDEDRAKLARSLRGAEIGADEEIKDEPAPKSDSGLEGGDENANGGPPAFVLQMRVSGGTYVRCIAHDVGHAVGSAAHVVTLTRSTQGRFTMIQHEQQTASEEQGGAIAEVRRCIPWEVFSRAMENKEGENKEGESEGEVDADGWKAWEREVLENMEVVE